MTAPSIPLPWPGELRQLLERAIRETVLWRDVPDRLRRPLRRYSAGAVGEAVVTIREDVAARLRRAK